MKMFIIMLISLLIYSVDAIASPCESEDFETKVSGNSECLLMRRYGPVNPKTLLVWLHGNVSTGGPANSHFKLAEKAADDLATDRVLAVALVRPGYPDGTGDHGCPCGTASINGDDKHEATRRSLSRDSRTVHKRNGKEGKMNSGRTLTIFAAALVGESGTGSH